MTCINCIRCFRMSSSYTKNRLQTTCQNSQVFCICGGKESSGPVMRMKIKGQLGHPYLILHQVSQLGRKIANFNKFGWKNTAASSFRKIACQFVMVENLSFGKGIIIYQLTGFLMFSLFQCYSEIKINVTNHNTHHCLFIALVLPKTLVWPVIWDPQNLGWDP